MATTVGRVELDVDADGSGLSRQMKVIGRKAGAEAGHEMGRSLNQAFERETTHFDKEGGITKIRESFKTIDKDWDKLSAKFGKNTQGMGRNLNVFRGHVMRTIGAWTLLIAIIGEGTAVLGSGLGASLTAILSSVALAAGAAGAALVPFVGALVTAIPFINSFWTAMSANQGIDIFKEINLAFVETGQIIAERLVPNVERLLDAFRSLASSQSAIDGMTRIIGSLFDGLSAGLESPGFQKFLTAIDGPIAAGFEALGRAIGSIIDGISAFAAAVSPLFQALSEDLALWAESWAEAMNASADNGGFTNFMNLARDSLLQVLDLVGALSGALGTLFEAGAPAGNALLGYLTDIIGQWDAWMQSIEGQKALDQWFANGQVIFMALADLLGDLGKVLADLVTPEAVASLVTFLDSLGGVLPILGEILGLVGDLQILNLLALALQAIGAVLTPIMPVLSEFATTLGVILTDALVRLMPQFAELGVQLVPLLQILAELAIAVLPGVITAIEGMLQYLALFVSALAGGREESGTFAEDLQVMGDIVRVVFEVIGNIVSAVLQAYGGTLKWVSQLMRGDFGGALKTMEEVARGVFKALGLNFDDFADWLDDMWREANKILREIGNFFEDFGDTIADVFGGIGNWISDAIGWFNSLFGAANNAASAASNARGYSTPAGGGPQRFASGGTVWGRTRAIMGESGPEAIVPLRRNLSQVDPSVRWLSALAQGKYPAFAGGGVSNGAPQRSVLVQPGAVVVQGVLNPDAAAVGVVNRIAERLG